MEYQIDNCQRLFRKTEEGKWQVVNEFGRYLGVDFRWAYPGIVARELPREWKTFESAEEAIRRFVAAIQKKRFREERRKAEKQWQEYHRDRENRQRILKEIEEAKAQKQRQEKRAAKKLRKRQAKRREVELLKQNAMLM